MEQFKKTCFLTLWMFFVMLTMGMEAGWANELFGGVTFIGDRKDVCVTVEGECISSIDFQLDTCDRNLDTKEE
ncbi:MAG: hypothetical protein KKC77_03885, partial [Proteobacteria bacterium]|nr:hypothetical protein [Pseudomonadota bacterium]